jgi:hypothetical protein
MAIDLLLKKMLEKFEQKRAPSLFLSSMFETGPNDVFKTQTGVIDVIRAKEKIAIDISPSTTGPYNKLNIFTTKEYKPPPYEEKAKFQARELFDRMPGQHPFDLSADNMARLIAKVTDDQAELQAKIERAIEKQASDALFTGTVALVNGDTVDYKAKATHFYDATAAWSTASITSIEADLVTGIELNRQDGKVDTDILVFSKESWLNFLKNTEMQKRFDWLRTNIVDIVPPSPNTQGASFHGTISIGSYTLQCWTYPQFYEVPTDAEMGLPSGTLTNAGTTQPYVPANKVLLLSSQTKLKKMFAGIEVADNRVPASLKNAFGLSSVPNVVAAEFYPWMKDDFWSKSLITGVSSNPLCVPVQIDGYSVLDTAP